VQNMPSRAWEKELGVELVGCGWWPSWELGVPPGVPGGGADAGGGKGRRRNRTAAVLAERRCWSEEGPSQGLMGLLTYFLTHPSRGDCLWPAFAWACGPEGGVENRQPALARPPRRPAEEAGGGVVAESRGGAAFTSNPHKTHAPAYCACRRL
jgi:hypothetical protein